MNTKESHVMRLLLLGLIILMPLVVWAVKEQRFSVLPSGTLAQNVTEAVRPGPEVLSIQESFVRISDQVKPAVVNISTVYMEKTPPQYEFFFGSPFEDFFGDFFGEQEQSPKGRRSPRTRPQMHRFEGTGSGVIINADGYILTNEHVVRGAKEIKVTLSNDKQYTGRVVGKDARTDIAVIKINAKGKIPFARLGDSDKIRVGEWAIAIGSPFGLDKTVTSGIISAVRQSLSIEGNEYRDLIQTDAAINRGNSGGPLCNINGEVVGINTAIFAPTGVFSGIGFAIPINSAKDILNDLISKGRVIRGWLGVEIRPVDQAIARQFNLPDQKGVLINNVIENSPARKACLHRGDIIREVNGKKVNDVRELQTVITHTEPNKKVTLRILRDRKEMNVQLTTGEMPNEEDIAVMKEQDQESSPEQIQTAEWQGMQVTTATDFLAQRFGFTSGEKGCVVLDVGQGTPAEEMGLMPGDVIRSVNRTPVPGINEFQTVIKKIKPQDGIVLDVNRQGQLLYLSYEGK
jgi:Do/DeqQ family serine protease